MSMSKIEVWWALGKFGKQTKKYLVVPNYFGKLFKWGMERLYFCYGTLYTP